MYIYIYICIYIYGPHSANSRVWGARGAAGELNSPPWLLVTALLLVTFGHSDWVVSRQPCCLAVYHCLVTPSLGLGNLPTSTLFVLLILRRFRGMQHSEN